MMRLAEEALRPHEQDGEGQDVGEPVFDAAADLSANVGFCELLTRPHDEAADDGARHEVKPPMMSTGSAFSARKVIEN